MYCDVISFRESVTDTESENDCGDPENGIRFANFTVSRHGMLMGVLHMYKYPNIL
jgi:hypothetical protein